MPTPRGTTNMFQRIRGAIDRTIAEEQARQQKTTERATSTSLPRNGDSSVAAAVRQSHQKKKRLDVAGNQDGVANPDPAVFEAAFSVDDNEEIRWSASPLASTMENTIAGRSIPNNAKRVPDHSGEDTSNNEAETGRKHDATSQQPDSTEPEKDHSAVAGPISSADETVNTTMAVADAYSPKADLPPEIRARLRKLEKLEGAYPQLLRSYRIAHGRATSIELFEKALRENTPLTSIREPDALVEYLNQISLKGDMVLDELKRVSAERDFFQQKLEVSSRESGTAKDVHKVNSNTSQTTEEGDKGEDNHPIDNIIPLLQAETAQKTSQIEQLKLEIQELREAATRDETTIADVQQATTLLTKEKKEQVAKLEKFEQTIHQTDGHQAQTFDTPSAPPQRALVSSRKKKNKKKRNTAPASSGVSSHADEEMPSETGPEHGAIDAPTDEIDSGLPKSTEHTQAKIARLEEEAHAKDKQIYRLSQRSEVESDLREEIESLKDDLVHIGQDFIDAKEKMKVLEREKAALTERLIELKNDAASSASRASTAEARAAQLEVDLTGIQHEHDSLNTRSALLQSELGAAQHLAQTRYKDITDLRAVLQRAQTELNNLRDDAAALKKTNEELAAKAAEVRSVEKRVKDLKLDAARSQRLAADREAEIKALREKLTMETNLKLKLEDDKRVAGLDLRQAKAENIELSAREEKTRRELETLQEELAAVQPRIVSLVDEVSKLRLEHEALHEEAMLKTSQYTNAQKLLSSMRDQMVELSIQLKEAQGQSESLDEELTECRKLLGERTREAETMRRLLSDTDERTESKVRELQAQLDAVKEERDHIEDDASTTARRRVREGEELRSRLKMLEEEVKVLAHERDKAYEGEREWRGRREEIEQAESRAAVEVMEMQATVASLRSALDASEQRVREIEKQRADLRRVLNEQRQLFEKKIRDSNESGGGHNNLARHMVRRKSGDAAQPSLEVGNGGNSNSASSSIDAMYLKTILLQFLEQKDNKLRAQLVPVLGKLLRFDKAEEQKWISAIQHLSAR